MTGPNPEELTPGEIARTLKRIEGTLTELQRQMQIALGPVTALGVRQDMTDRMVADLERKVEQVQARSLFFAGGVAGIGSIINFLWKR